MRAPKITVTLTEALVVAVAATFAAGVMGVRLSAAESARSLDADARALAADLRAAHATAIHENRAVTITFDPAGSAYGETSADTLMRLAETALTITVDAPQDCPNARPCIRFAPDGGSNGGAVTLARDGRAVAVTVDWLTGDVSVGHTSSTSVNTSTSAGPSSAIALANASSSAPASRTASP